MARTIALYAVAAFLVAVNWLRLEEPRVEGFGWLWIVALALVPALVEGVRRRMAALVAATLLAAASAFELSLLDARIWEGDRDFVGPLLSRFRTGFLNFYDVALPFDGGNHPYMHGVVVAAIFGFCLLIGLAISTGHPLAAAVALVVGAGWPATLISGGNELLRGAVILAGALVLIAGVSGRDGKVLARGVAAAAAVCVAAIAASTSPAVAKDEFFENWKQWDLYSKPENPVTVRYVWNSNYEGINFPKKKTVVLEIAAPPRSLYWRATTLDDFDGRGWVEDEDRLVPGSGIVAVDDPLLPRAARDSRRWVEQRVEVAALRDRHLIAASTPVSYEVEPSEIGPVLIGQSGVAFVLNGLERGARYRAFSYAPHPTQQQLGRVQLPYPEEIELGGYLNVLPGVASPPFGTLDREQQLERLLESYRAADPRIDDYRRLYRRALDVVGDAETPYAATVALEAWLRSGGGFTYDEQPPRARGVPPLVHFVVESKRGYCQHYAGAMALMLRWLGIPARVAAGFVSGRYDSNGSVWTVTDHDAHTWVEVWFRGFGWLAFDPTPGRGRLSGSYTSASQQFRPSSIITQSLGVIGREAVETGASVAEREALRGTGADSGRDVPGDVPGLVTRERGESLLRFLLLLGLVLAAGIVVAKQLVRRGRFLTQNPRRIASACRKELADFVADQGIKVAPSATLAELSEVLASELAVDGRRFAAATTSARFARPLQARQAAADARSELRALERVIRRRLGPVERVRGLLSLRSLGFMP